MPNDSLHPAFKRHLFSHYAYSGGTVAIGVATISLIGYLLFGVNFFALTFGALCVSINDVPTPARHKLLETLSGLMLGTLTTLIVASAQGSTLRMGLTILCTSFVAALVTVYGRKAMPLSFSMFFAIVLAMILPLHGMAAVLEHAGRFLLGGSLYVAYAVAIAHRLNFRTRQQALGECVQALADYMRAQAAFFDRDTEDNAAYSTLIARQVTVAEKLQIARDLVFRQMRSAEDGMLAATLVEALNLFEHLLSAQTDYAALRQRYANTDLTLFLRDIALKGALDLEQIGDTLLRGEARHMEVNYKAELYAIEYEIERLRREPSPATENLGAVLDSVAKARGGIAQIDRVRAASHTPVEPRRAVDGLTIDPFLSRPNFRPGLLLANLHLRSPVFRYALRIALAMSLGYVVDLVLPYTSHGYWILLTIAVVMRSSFSLTRSRYWDRVAGNLIGCFIAALLLWVTQNPIVILAVMFTAVGVSHAYATVNFRITAIASCLMGLLPAHFIDPGASYLVAERLLDTAVGAVIAYGFSFVLPNWEKTSIAQLVDELTQACAAYAQVSLQLSPNLLNYRLARKHAIDAITALGQASQRMRDEPQRQHAAFSQINGLLTASHLLAAQLASVHILFEHRRDSCDAATLGHVLSDTVRQTQALLTAAVPPEPTPDTGPAVADTSHLQLRLDAICRAAHDIRTLAASVKAG